MIKTKLRIQYTQKYDDHKDQSESIVDATIGQKNGSTYLIFKEVDGGTKVVIENMVKIKEGKVTVRRTGGLKSELRFDITKDYHTRYQTPYGELEVGIVTKEIHTKFEAETIMLKLRYEMYISGQRTSENSYEVHSIQV